MQLLQSEFKVPEALLCYLPFIVDSVGTGIEGNTDIPGFTLRQYFMTVGNFKHEPNYDAVLYLKETLWPAIETNSLKPNFIFMALTPQKR